MSKPKIQHVGTCAYRTKDSPWEKAFADRWNSENHPPSFLNSGVPVLTLLLHSDGTGRVTGNTTQEEATAAATVIQWLGSNVGFCFLRECLKECGFDVVRRKDGLKV
jgi:hypothetical protein